jgi:ribonuclease T
MSYENEKAEISRRFRGFLPVAVDVETGGFNAQTDALLEIAAVTMRMNERGVMCVADKVSCHVQPFEGANLEEAALAFNKIDPWHPFRFALPETEALSRVFEAVRKLVKSTGCTRAVLVGHNPFFDLGFVKAAVERTGIKDNPFHSFTTFDTATLGGLAYGQTVLSRAVKAAGLDWNEEEAHSALYDAERTAQLFCTIVNRFSALYAADAGR